MTSVLPWAKIRRNWPGILLDTKDTKIYYSYEPVLWWIYYCNFLVRVWQRSGGAASHRKFERRWGIDVLLIMAIVTFQDILCRAKDMLEAVALSSRLEGSMSCWTWNVSSPSHVHTAQPVVSNCSAQQTAIEFSTSSHISYIWFRIQKNSRFCD